MLLKTFLIALVTILGYSEWLLGTSLIQRPIILGPIVGAVLGDLNAGIVMGATLELAMIGAVSIGAYVPPDMVSGTILGVAFTIVSGAPVSQVVILGLPVASLMLAANTVIGQPLILWLIHKMDKYAEKAEIKKFSITMVIAGYIQSLPGIIFVPLAFYFGSDYVASFIGIIPEFVQTGIDIATGLLPALGFAMLAQMLMSKKVLPFFFLGFFLVAYSGMSTVAVSIFAIIISVIFLYYITPNNNNLKLGKEKGDKYDEF